MTRAQILVEVLARLEAERYGTPVPEHRSGAVADYLPPVTPEQAARNLQLLTEAIGGDLHVIEHNEREAS